MAEKGVRRGETSFNYDELSNKQRLALSPKVYNVMEDELINFMAEDNMAGYYNRVIAGMLGCSEANVLATAADIRADLKDLYRIGDTFKVGGKRLSDTDGQRILERTREEFALALAKARRQRLVDKSRREPAQGEDWTLTLNEENQNSLQVAACNWVQRNAGVRQNKDELFKNRKAFIETLLEDYASRSSAEREEIFFQDIFKAIENAIENGRTIVIRTRRLTSTRIDLKKKSGRIGKPKAAETEKFVTDAYVMIPYKIVLGNRGQYHYLVGMSRSQNRQDEEMTISSFRISRIKSVKESYAGELTADQERKIDARIMKFGVEYILDRKEVRAFFTNAAAARFAQDENAPEHAMWPETIDGGQIYRFRADLKAVREYVSSYGDAACVIDPVVKVSMTPRGLEIYQKDPEGRLEYAAIEETESGVICTFVDWLDDVEEYFSWNRYGEQVQILDPVVRVYLTKAGIKRYGGLVRNRPRHIAAEEAADGGEILTYTSAPFQIHNYFYQFGDEARILEPWTLDRQFRYEYKRAVDMYSRPVEEIIGGRTRRD